MNCPKKTSRNLSSTTVALVGVGIVLALLAGLWWWDRRTRKRGHTLRSPNDIWRSERHVRRNIRQSSELGHNPIDRDWNKPDDQRYKNHSSD